MLARMQACKAACKQACTHAPLPPPHTCHTVSCLSLSQGVWFLSISPSLLMTCEQ